MRCALDDSGLNDTIGVMDQPACASILFLFLI